MVAVRGIGQLLGCLVETLLNRWHPPGDRHGYNEPAWTDGT